MAYRTWNLLIEEGDGLIDDGADFTESVLDAVAKLARSVDVATITLIDTNGKTLLGPFFTPDEWI
jgi:hypothetical protein